MTVEPPPVVLIHTESAASAKRSCGECSMCCKLLGVKSIKKERNKWCEHCNPGQGCRVYGEEQRPTECNTFECLWLQSNAEQIPEDWRPDKLKVVFSVTPHDHIISAYVDRGYHWVFTRPDVRNTLERLVHMGHQVMVFEGDSSQALVKKQVEPELSMTAG